MFQLAEAQESLLRKAVIHSDRWKEYEHLEVDQDKWFSMSIKTQKHHLSRVYSEQLGSGPIVVSTSNDSNDYINKVKLDVDYSMLINSYQITNTTLEDIWKKAVYLISMHELISFVPGQSNSNNRMVASVNGGEPHYVEEKKGKFVCNGKCPRFFAYKICQHVVAAAQARGMLNTFCSWWKSQKADANKDVLAMVDLPKGAGQKGGVCKRRCRGTRRGGISSSAVRTERITSDANSQSLDPPSVSQLLNVSQLSQVSNVSQASILHQILQCLIMVLLIIPSTK